MFHPEIVMTLMQVLMMMMMTTTTTQPMVLRGGRNNQPGFGLLHFRHHFLWEGRPMAAGFKLIWCYAVVRPPTWHWLMQFQCFGQFNSPKKGGKNSKKCIFGPCLQFSGPLLSRNLLPCAYHDHSGRGVLQCDHQLLRESWAMAAGADIGWHHAAAKSFAKSGDVQRGHQLLWAAGHVAAGTEVDEVDGGCVASTWCDQFQWPHQFLGNQPTVAAVFGDFRHVADGWPSAQLHHLQHSHVLLRKGRGMAAGFTAVAAHVRIDGCMGCHQF